jgi:hypothetical protein
MKEGGAAMGGVKSKEQLASKLVEIRQMLEPAFRSDTALGPYNPDIPSTGHCAAVAAIVESALGGSFASAMVGSVSHWFNRFVLDSGVFDADITGDQFGYTKIRIEKMGTLFEGTRERQKTDLNDETRKRAKVLAQRAGMRARVTDSA